MKNTKNNAPTQVTIKVNTETDTSLGWKQHIKKLHTFALLLILSNVTTSVFATTQSATLHTFAGEGVGEIISGNIAHSVFIPVSDAGDAVYLIDGGQRPQGGVKPLPRYFSLDLGEGVIQQVEPNGAHVLQISRDGGRIMVGGMMYDKAESYQVERGSSGGNALMSLDGRMMAGSKKESIASGPDYPWYQYISQQNDQLKPYGYIFFRWAKNSQGPVSHDGMIMPTEGTLYDRRFVETLNHHLYRNVYLIAIDGTSSQFLTRYQGNLPRQEGQLAEAMELRLMDRQGRYGKKHLRASTRSRALLSDNAEFVAAVKGLEGCDSADAELKFCGVLWNTVNDTRLSLGRFAPKSMSGDATLIIGSRISQDNVTGPAIDNDFWVWTSEAGLQSFAEFSEGLGLDFSGWTDLRPANVSPDGTKITGVGYPAGSTTTTGFMIDMPQRQAERWTLIPASNDAVSKLGTWDSHLVDSVTGQDGGSLSFRFEGSKVKVHGLTGLAQGYANIFIDDVFWGSVDTFSCSLPEEHILFESGYLGDGEHDIRIQVFGVKNAASEGTQISITAFEVEEPVTQTPVFLGDDHIPAPSHLVLDQHFHVMAQQYKTNVFAREQLNWDLTSSDWISRIHERQEVSVSLSETIDVSGNFSVEFWFSGTLKPLYNWFTGESTYAPLLDMAQGGKRLSLNTYDARVADPSTSTGGTWKHVVLTGNWSASSASLYVNGEYARDIVYESIEHDDLDQILLGRSFHFDNSQGPSFGEAEFAKFATYNETLTGTQTSLLFEQPTQFGLSFAPSTSPEYSTALPGCSLGCEPGLETPFLPIHMGVTDTPYNGPTVGSGSSFSGSGGF